MPVPAIFSPFYRELPVKLTNQVGRYYHMTFQNGGRHRKLSLDRRKRSQFDHTVVRKAMRICVFDVTSSGYINRFKKDATIFFSLLSRFSERFLERFRCKIIAAANNFFRFAVAILFGYIGWRNFKTSP